MRFCNPPTEVKMDAIHRCSELGESIKYVSEEIGCNRAGIYAWRKKYLQGGTVALMNGKNIKTSTLAEGTRDSPIAEMQQLLARMDKPHGEGRIGALCPKRDASLTIPPAKGCLAV